MSNIIQVQVLSWAPFRFQFLHFHSQQANIVGKLLMAREPAGFLDHFGQQLLGRQPAVQRDRLGQPLLAEDFAGRTFLFDQAVGVKYQEVLRAHRPPAGGVFGILKQAQGRSLLAVGVGFQNFHRPGRPLEPQWMRMGRAGVGQLPGGHVHHHVGRRREHRGTGLSKDLEQRLVDFREQLPGGRRRQAQILHHGVYHGGDQGGAHVVAHHIANENAHGRFRQLQDVEEIAAGRAARQIIAEEFQRLHAIHENGRKVLRQHGELEFASHFQLIRHLLGLLVKQPGLFGQGDFRLFARRDVPRNAEGADNPAGLIAQRHLGGGDPGDAAVGPRFGFLEAFHGQAGAHDGLFIGQSLLGVRRREIIGVAFADRLLRVRQMVLFGERAADHQEPAARVLEIDRVRNAVHQCLQQKPFMIVGQLAIVPVQGFAEGGDQTVSGELLLDEVVLRPQRDGAGRNFLCRCLRQHHHRSLRRGGMHLAECVQAGAVGQR
ncbi:MAG: hypothetical protein ABSH48_23180 [Verrucomicrobiota bacterium]